MCIIDSYIAARNENYENLIKPHLNKKVILIDRFVDSTIAYQHYGFKINKRVIKELNNFILGNLKPNFTFFHYVPTKSIKKIFQEKKINTMVLAKIFIIRYKMDF